MEGARAAVACVAAGVAWLLLVPASALDLSSSAYHGMMAGALVVAAVAWWLVGRTWPRGDLRARSSFWLVLAGFALTAAAAVLEAGGLFVLGLFLLLVGGPTAAVALRRAGLPFWALVFVCLLGFGVLGGDLCVDAPPLAALGGLGLFAAGWIALGLLLRERPYAFSSTPT